MDSTITDNFSLIDNTEPELFIPLSKYPIEVNENDTLQQSFQVLSVTFQSL